MQETLSNNTQNKIILITGATSGIGYALSEIYLKNGWIVIGLGRDETKIKKFFIDFPDSFYFYQIDLNSFQNTNKIFEEIFSKFKNINTFILNAGIYIPENFQNFKFINAQETFNVNVLSIYLIIEKIKSFFELTHSHTIAIISSVAGYRGLPRSILYGPSKSALINLAEALKIDLPKVNIKLINPGFVETPATSINQFKMPFLISAEKAAIIIFTKIYQKGFEISFPFPFNILMKFGRILPYRLYFKITKRISNKDEK